ncbi:MAG: hypothetical protein GY858_05555 [Candidatus Omnitrophica bacterium]|nr:hypothetical protein [Candidatus Omnitrophota bacterium]
MSFHDDLFSKKETKIVQSNGTILRKPEIKFWSWFFGVVLIGVIAFVRLQSDVSAMKEKGTKLRTEFETSNQVLLDIQTRTIRTETQLELIVKKLDSL